jgi:Flp pilus assembly protein TadD
MCVSTASRGTQRRMYRLDDPVFPRPSNKIPIQHTAQGAVLPTQVAVTPRTGKLSLFALLFLSLTSVIGCSSVPQLKRSTTESRSSAKPAESPMSQLGVALPAMKPGDDRELKLIAAEQMAEHGYWNEAVELYLEAESMAPKKPKLNKQLAPAFAATGRFPESLQRYRALIQDEPKNAKIINNYAFTLQESGDVSGAEAEFRKALSIDAKFENAAVNLGLLLARQRRYDEALQVLTPAIGEAAAHHNVGVVAIDCGDEPTARLHFGAASSLPGAPKESREFLVALARPVGNALPKTTH